MKTVFFCSTPNFRGIHQYCLYVERLVSTFAVVRLQLPDSNLVSRLPVFRFLYQFFWELFPCGGGVDADFEIYASPRLPIRSLLFKTKSNLCGVFLLDFIQCIEDWSPRSLWSLYSDNGILELAKRIVHTLHFNLSLRRLDFVISISNYTSNCLSHWSPRDCERLWDHSIVLHPSPSFSRSSVEKGLASLKTLFDPSVFRIHVVTGFSPSKQPLLLEKCLSSLKPLAQRSSRSFEINIFGYGSSFLHSISSPIFQINCHSGYVDESLLIQSSLLANLFVSTSLQEGFGIPLLDSVLFGLDCVCTPIPPFREIASTYSNFGNSVRFVSSCDVSNVEEFGELILASSSRFLQVDPVLRANNYLIKSSKIEHESRERLLAFLEDQLESCP